MTTEEKAKRFDEALERARKLYNEAKANEYTSDMEDYEAIFPELKESEDERIRKAIIIYLDWLDGRKDYAPKEEFSIRDMIAWLEKQGQKETLCDKCRKEQPSHSCQDITELGRCALEKQGEQKHVVDFKAEDWYVSKIDGKIYNAKFYEKNPINQARKLEIEKAAISATGIIEREEWFIKGAEWADENPKEGLVDINKACEWLEIKAPFYLRSVSTSIEQNSTLSNPRYIGAWLDTKGLVEQFQKDMKS